MKKNSEQQASGAPGPTAPIPPPLAPILMMAFWMLLGGAAGIKLAQSVWQLLGWVPGTCPSRFRSGVLLRMSSHDVRVAHSGPAGLEAALEYRPNVVLLDIGLPGMNGYELARHLRQQPELNGVKLIAMTGYGRESDLQRSQAAGFDHHLVKPVNPLRLLELLATFTTQITL